MCELPSNAAQGPPFKPAERLVTPPKLLKAVAQDQYGLRSRVNTPLGGRAWTDVRRFRLDRNPCRFRLRPPLL